MIAFKELGFKIDRYVAYEIDKYAIKTSLHNFPFIEQMGDVFQGDFTQYRDFEFLVGGSPCTHWSIAQKNNRETTASGVGWELFSQYVRALKETRPKFFLYENNKSMSQAIRDSISATFGFEPICINSALLSAQNRNRLYWVGKRNDDGTYSKVDVEQPEDRGILLQNIIETGVAWQTKSYAYTTRCQGATPSDTLKRHRHTMVAEPVVFNTPHGYNKGGIKYDKSPTLTANGSWATNNYIIEPVRKSYTDNKIYTVYPVKDGVITIKDKEYPIKLDDGYYIMRKLTVRECMRLQTVPEWYEFPVSNTQAYKMLGNGWTVEVIKHLISHCK